MCCSLFHLIRIGIGSKKGEVQRKRAIPKKEVIIDGLQYTMNKRCERMFIPDGSSEKYEVSNQVQHKKTCS